MLQFLWSNVLVLLLGSFDQIYCENQFVSVDVRRVVTQKCPISVNKDSKNLLDSADVTIKPKYRIQNRDSVTLNVKDKRDKTSITFPGCYQVKVKLVSKVRVNNPYAEVYLQMGKEIPCRHFDTNDERQFKNETCSKCPRSQNWILRSQKEKKMCHFCDLCQSGNNLDQKIQKFVKIDGGELKADCSIQNPREPFTLTLDICTPSPQEIRDWDEENSDRKESLGDYWQYLQQGALTIVIHVMDRGVQTQQEKQDCGRLCQAYDQQIRYVSRKSAFLGTLKDQMSKLCTPRDQYVGCVYSAVQFTTDTNIDINGK